MQRNVDEPLLSSFVGRREALRQLARVLTAPGPRVLFIHGLAGVGKSSLLERFVMDARRQVAVVAIDCGDVEPTVPAFLRALTGRESLAADVDDAVAQLAAAGPGVLVLDHWERFGLLDAWTRQELVPRLPADWALVIAGQHPPRPAWHASSSADAPVRSLALDVLSSEETMDLLTREGITGSAAVSLHQLTRGLPLALRVAAVTAGDAPRADMTTAALPEVTHAIAETYLRGLDALLIRAVEALSVVRRGTATLLPAMLGPTAPDLVPALARLPFVQATVDGLALHDALRSPLAASFRGADPVRHTTYRRAAWRQLSRELRTAPPIDRWRYTADLLYLIEHPLVRGAFFPPGGESYSVEPAEPDDFGAIRAIAATHLQKTTAATVTEAWSTHPGRFRVTRDADGQAVAFLCLLDATVLTVRWARADPLLSAVHKHLRSDPVPPGQRTLIVLAALSGEAGEGQVPPLSALWLDVKRTYLDHRVVLRRVYVQVRDPGDFLAAAGPLGFMPTEEPVEVDGVAHTLAVLDFGPSCVDGWLAWLASQQVGGEHSAVLDTQTRSANLEGGPVPLSRLEFGVLDELVKASGRTVSRIALTQAVWGSTYTGGSNVVDAVVRTLRRKLGNEAARVETVRGVGYRYRAPDS